MTYRLLAAPEGWPETLPFRLRLADRDVAVGEEFEADLSPDQERANIESGLLERVE